MTEGNSYINNNTSFQDEIEFIVNNITKRLDSNRYYNLFELRKIAKKLPLNLPGRLSLGNIKVISKVFLRNMPHQLFTNGKVIGEVIIKHLHGSLKNKIFEKFGIDYEEETSNNLTLTAATPAVLKSGEKGIECDGDNLAPTTAAPAALTSEEKGIECDGYNLAPTTAAPAASIPAERGKDEENLAFAVPPVTIPIARVIPESHVKVVKCCITETYQGMKDINGKYVTFKPFEGVKVLGQIGNIFTVNDTPNKILVPTMISDVTDEIDKLPIIELDSRIANVYVRKVIDGNRKRYELGNAPPTATDIHLATERDMEVFFESSAEYPVYFLRTIGHLSFIPKFSLSKIIRRHNYVLGITDAGKGYFANAFLLSCVGRTIKIAPNVYRKVGCLYFDFTGQFTNDSYGFFEAWVKESGEDPRVIIPGDEIGVQTSEDLIEIFFRKYRILDLGFAPQKIAAMRRYLLNRITIDSSFMDFQRELPCAIRNTYSGNPTNHLERIASHLRALGPSIWNEEIEPLKSPELFRDVDNHLRNGRFVIVDLSRIHEREYKPGIVYRILRFLDELLNENFSNTHREMDYPLFVGIDEAHNFAGATSNLRRGYYVDECNNLIARMCAEDRKTGLCMVIITQRLAWTNRDVRANIGLWCVSKISSVDEDQAKKCMGNHEFLNYRYRTFRLFGDSSPIPQFPARALNPAELAKLKKAVEDQVGS